MKNKHYFSTIEKALKFVELNNVKDYCFYTPEFLENGVDIEYEVTPDTEFIEILSKRYSKYFNYLENLRKSGRTNMFFAGEYLKNETDIDESLVNVVLRFWMDNYERLKNYLYW